MKPVVIRNTDTHASHASRVSCWTHIPSPAASHSGLVVDAWEVLSRGLSRLFTAAATDPQTPVPHKVKQVSDKNFKVFQKTLEYQGLSMPYCARQYFNGRGERYVVSRAYHFGSFGHVHIGVRSSDGQEVALKEIPIQGAWVRSPGPKENNPHKRYDAMGNDLTPVKMATPLEQVEQEIALGEMAGDKPLDTFVHDGRMFVVRELMAGDTFDVVVNLCQNGRSERSRDFTLALMKNVAGAMAQVHARGVVHRDLKLENVLRSADGCMRVTDWGWAAPLAPNSCMTGVAVGTPGAIPLEALEGHMTDHRFDVFSLGTMVVTAAIGRRIFEGGDGRSCTHELADFDGWLEEMRDPEVGDFDLFRVAHSREKWADCYRQFESVVGTNVAVFVFNRMLTGLVCERATMADVAQFCDGCKAISPAVIERAAVLCREIAAKDIEREKLMLCIKLFDWFFSKDG